MTSTATTTAIAANLTSLYSGNHAQFIHKGLQKKQLRGQQDLLDWMCSLSPTNSVKALQSNLKIKMQVF